MNRKRENGQAAVEFTVFTVILFFSLFIVLQMVWLGVQKWQFNHFASYAARVWSVHKDQTPGQSLIRLLGPQELIGWSLPSHDYVAAIWVWSTDPVEDEDGTSYSGVTYRGVAPLFPFYRDQVGDTFFNAFIPPEILSLLPFQLPSTGLVVFETFIPMEKEPDEQPGPGRDNDCYQTPCESGNAR
jgi:hypothetical protein